MPFELGLFIGLGRQGTSLLLIDQKYKEVDGRRIRKFGAQLSNLKGAEIIVHENNSDVLARSLQRDFETMLQRLLCQET